MPDQRGRSAGRRHLVLLSSTVVGPPVVEPPPQVRTQRGGRARRGRRSQPRLGRPEWGKSQRGRRKAGGWGTARVRARAPPPRSRQVREVRRDWCGGKRAKRWGGGGGGGVDLRNDDRRRAPVTSSTVRWGRGPPCAALPKDSPGRRGAPTGARSAGAGGRGSGCAARNRPRLPVAGGCGAPLHCGRPRESPYLPSPVPLPSPPPAGSPLRLRTGDWRRQEQHPPLASWRLSPRHAGGRRCHAD